MSRPERSPKYLNFIRGRPCAVTGTEGDAVVAHHIRCLGGGGVGQKPTDYYCVPLTAEQHSKLHAEGEKSFWKRHGIDPAELVQMQLLVYLATNHRGKDVADELRALVVRLERRPSEERSGRDERAPRPG